MKIDHTNECIRYMGRIAHLSDGAHCYYAGSLAEIRFVGSSISVEILHKNIWGVHSLTYSIDGKLGKIPMRDAQDGIPVTHLLADSLDARSEHTLILYKQTDASHCLTIKSFETDGQFLPASPAPELKLEFYGDSVTVGVCCEADDFVGCTDPVGADCIYDNAWYSYAVQTALALHAQFHLVAQGGIALFDHTGYFSYPNTVGMESVYDKLCYFPEAGEVTAWDFSRYIPDIVVFAIGQNDPHDPTLGTNSIDIHDAAVRERWINGYQQLVHHVHANYPETTEYVFLLTLLMHDSGWDDAVAELTERLQREGIAASHLKFKRCGIATHGHPRRSEHTEMASELTEYLRVLLKEKSMIKE